MVNLNTDVEARGAVEALWSGFWGVMTEDGYIVSNHHVVHDQRGGVVDEIRVRFNDGREYKAELVGSDKKTDVAVLKIKPDAKLDTHQRWRQ